MNNWDEYLYEYMRDNFEGLNIDLESDEMQDKFQKWGEDLEDSIQMMAEFASYGTPAQYNYGVDNTDKRTIEKLRDDIRLLERGIQEKGFNMYVENGHVYEEGIRHCGGTINASFKDKIL